MDMLSTPFEGYEIPAAVPGSWSAATTTLPVLSLPQVDRFVVGRAVLSLLAEVAARE